MRIIIELDNGMVTTHEVSSSGLTAARVPSVAAQITGPGAAAPQADQAIDGGPAPGAGAAPGTTTTSVESLGPGSGTNAGAVNAGAAPQGN